MSASSVRLKEISTSSVSLAFLTAIMAMEYAGIDPPPALEDCVLLSLASTCAALGVYLWKQTPRLLADRKPFPWRAVAFALCPVVAVPAVITSEHVPMIRTAVAALLVVSLVCIFTLVVGQGLLKIQPWASRHPNRVVRLFLAPTSRSQRQCMRESEQEDFS